MSSPIRRGSPARRSSGSLKGVVTPDGVLWSSSHVCYRIGEMVGATAPGAEAIWRAIHEPTNDVVAIRRMNMDRVLDTPALYNAVLNAMRLSRTQLGHPNLLPYLTSFWVPDPFHELWIVQPYIVHGSVRDILRSEFQTGFAEPLVAHLIKHLLRALHYLHSRGLVHRNVTSANLLIDHSGDGRLSGCEHIISTSSAIENGLQLHDFHEAPQALPYMAPEYLRQDMIGYNNQIDIYSAGIVAIEMAMGTPPFHDMAPTEILLRKLQDFTPGLGEAVHFSRAFHSFTQDCVCEDPNSRPPAARLLTGHPFFKQVRRAPSNLQKFLKSLQPQPSRSRLISEGSIDMMLSTSNTPPSEGVKHAPITRTPFPELDVGGLCTTMHGRLSEDQELGRSDSASPTETKPETEPLPDAAGTRLPAKHPLSPTITDFSPRTSYDGTYDTPPTTGAAGAAPTTSPPLPGADSPLSASLPSSLPSSPTRTAALRHSAGERDSPGSDDDEPGPIQPEALGMPSPSRSRSNSFKDAAPGSAGHSPNMERRNSPRSPSTSRNSSRSSVHSAVQAGRRHLLRSSNSLTGVAGERGPKRRLSPFVSHSGSIGSGAGSSSSSAAAFPRRVSSLQARVPPSFSPSSSDNDSGDEDAAAAASTGAPAAAAAAATTSAGASAASAAEADRAALAQLTGHSATEVSESRMRSRVSSVDRRPEDSHSHAHAHAHAHAHHHHHHHHHPPALHPHHPLRNTHRRKASLDAAALTRSSPNPNPGTPPAGAASASAPASRRRTHRRSSSADLSTIRTDLEIQAALAEHRMEQQQQQQGVISRSRSHASSGRTHGSHSSMHSGGTLSQAILEETLHESLSRLALARASEEEAERLRLAQEQKQDACENGAEAAAAAAEVDGGEASDEEKGGAEERKEQDQPEHPKDKEHDRANGGAGSKSPGSGAGSPSKPQLILKHNINEVEV